MNWNAMTTDHTPTVAILTDHQPDLTRLEDHAWRTYGIHRYGQSYLRGYRQAQADTIGWVMRMLTDGFDNLTGPEVIRELRKKDQSLYWPILSDENNQPRTVTLLCDRCRTHQLFTDSGVCPHCGTEME